MWTTKCKVRLGCSWTLNRSLENQILNPPFCTSLLKSFPVEIPPDEMTVLLNEAMAMVEPVKAKPVVQESPVYDHSSYPQVQRIRFEELKNAFVQFDPARKGTMKTIGSFLLTF